MPTDEAPGSAPWPLAALAAGVLLGTALQLQQAQLSSTASYQGSVAAGAFGVLLTAILWARWGRVGPVWRLGIVLLVLMAAGSLGWGGAGWRAALRLSEVLPAELEGQDLLLSGIVQDLPVQRSEGVRFLFAVEAAERLSDGTPVRVPSRLSLGWYRGWGEGAELSRSARALAPGQRWQWVVRLKRPHGSLNPHGFDAELWLFERGVRATGSVRPEALPAARLLDEHAGGWRGAAVGELIDRWRLRLREALQQQLGQAASPAVVGVLAALVIGDQAAIDRDDWAVFRSTGVAHLMAISGLHVTMLAWVAGMALSAGWRRSRWLMLRCPAPTAARWGGLLAAVAYALLAGWGVPAQRTVLMLAVVAWLGGRAARWPWPRVLCVAALVVVLLDPWALLQAGFWLSFTAVAMLLADGASVRSAEPPGSSGGLAAEHRLRTWTARLGDTLRLQLLMSVGLAPLTLLFFHQVSLVGLLANLVAIPWVTFLVTPLALLGVLLPPLWLVAAPLVDGLMGLLGGLAGWPLASWQAAAAPVWAVLAGLLGAALLAAPLPRRWRLLGLPLLLPLLDPPLLLPPHGQFDLLAADIGQGTAVLLRTRHHALLYDTGPRYSSESDAGERVLVPLLRAFGVARLDLLVLSHRDQDHVGGAPAVLREVGAWRVTGGLESGHPLRTLAPYQPCLAGQHWVWDGVRFDVLHPTPADYELAAHGALRPNGLSCVVRARASQGDARAVLLTGDIERLQELRLLEIPADLLRADILLVPHHGSRTSSTPEWLERVAPRWAVAQIGYRNRYAHPAPQVMNSYLAHKISVFRTDKCGAWHFDGAHDAFWCERTRAQRYWQTPDQGGEWP